MDHEATDNKKISYDEKAGKDVVKVSFLIIGLVVLLYLLTITVLPVYAR